MRANEIQPRKLVIFDIDDTLVHTQTKVQVVKDGRAIKALNSHDFTHYKLQPGESFDFENFRNAQEFFNNSKPIIPMMNQLKQDISTGNKVVMVTARADFDDRELFLDTFRKYGVDMDRVHVYRAGNMTGKIQTEEKKKIIIRKLLDQGQYTKAIMYDDAVPNLESFVELKREYPKTRFYAWHVSLEGEASEYHRTNENQTLEERKKKRRVRRAAYGPGPFGGYGYAVGYSGDGGGGDAGGGIGEGQSDYEIHNYNKLDKILSKLCDMVVKGKQERPEYYGMVAAAVLDPDNQIVARINRPGQDGKRIHAEHAAMLDYTSKYGEIPEGSIVITTLSPCNEQMAERDGPSCTELINNSPVKKVYCGYMDPTQDDDTRQFNLMETADKQLRTKCKQFADTFLDIDENLANMKNPGMGEYPALTPPMENFADGRNPQDKGDSKRHGVPTKASVSTLRKVAKQGGRKGQLAHWMANMKAGKKK
jgi:pyrimidine deaminase RibD-like protein/FMN phosphatase YigB (HAD superfamily)